MLTKLFKPLVDKAGISDFARDQGIVKKYTGAILTRPQFDQYCSQFLLRNELGNDKKYYGFGTPMESSGALILADILRKLHSAGVTLDLGSEGSAFRKKLARAFEIYPVQNFSWLKIPEPYTQAAEIQDAVQGIKQTFPYLGNERYSYS